MGTYKQFEGKKASFSEMLNAEDQNLHNSNMLNLVSATRKINSELEYLDNRQKELTKLKAEIQAYADSGNVTDTDKVSELFNRQRNNDGWKFRSW